MSYRSVLRDGLYVHTGGFNTKIAHIAIQNLFKSYAQRVESDLGFKGNYFWTIPAGGRSSIMSIATVYFTETPYVIPESVMSIVNTHNIV